MRRKQLYKIRNIEHKLDKLYEMHPIRKFILFAFSVYMYYVGYVMGDNPFNATKNILALYFGLYFLTKLASVDIIGRRNFFRFTTIFIIVSIYMIFLIIDILCILLEYVCSRENFMSYFHPFLQHIYISLPFLVYLSLFISYFIYGFFKLKIKKLIYKSKPDIFKKINKYNRFYKSKPIIFKKINKYNKI